MQDAPGIEPPGQNCTPRSCSVASAGRRASSTRLLSAPSRRTSRGALVLSRCPEALHSHLESCTQRRVGSSGRMVAAGASSRPGDQASPRPAAVQGLTRTLGAAPVAPAPPLHAHPPAAQSRVAPQGLAVDEGCRNGLGKAAQPQRLPPAVPTCVQGGRGPWARAVASCSRTPQSMWSRQAGGPGSTLTWQQAHADGVAGQECGTRDESPGQRRPARGRQRAAALVVACESPGGRKQVGG